MNDTTVMQARGETVTVEHDQTRQLAHYEEIKAMQRTVKRFEQAMILAKASSKAAKDKYDEAAAELSYLIERGPDAQLTLFEKKPQSWKEIELHQALDDLPPKIMQALKDAEIETVGDLVCWTDEGVLTDIKGIGPKAAEQIEDSMHRFWEHNPDLIDEEAVGDGGDDGEE